MIIPLVLSTIIFTSNYVKAETVVSEYVAKRSDLRESELQARGMMAKIHEINSRMKQMSRIKGKNNNQLLYVENKTKNLARKQAKLEEEMKNQRIGLSKRLRALYMVGENQLMRLVFSATSSQDLYQNMKFMRLVTESDYKLIKSYKKSILNLNRTTKRLKTEVSRLIAVRRSVSEQEAELEGEQAHKLAILNDLKASKVATLSQLSDLRQQISLQNPKLFDFSFFENRGKLSPPADAGRVVRNYGIIEHPEYAYKLSHSGLLIEGAGNIRAIFNGSVAFFGEISGYGKTLILDHGDHYYSVYGNLESSDYKIGDHVKKSQVISKLSGQLYFELRHFSEAIDPKKWLISEVGSET